MIFCQEPRCTIPNPFDKSWTNPFDKSWTRIGPTLLTRVGQELDQPFRQELDKSTKPRPNPFGKDVTKDPKPVSQKTKRNNLTRNPPTPTSVEGNLTSVRNLCSYIPLQYPYSSYLVKGKTSYTQQNLLFLVTYPKTTPNKCRTYPKRNLLI